MKSEKEFVESMWTIIDSEQTEIIQEMMVKERNKQMRNRSIRIFLVFILTFFILFIGLYFLNLLNSVAIIFVICLLFTIGAYVIESLSYREAKECQQK